MEGGKHLLLLAVSVFLARCQQNPQVSMSPTLEQIFSGDLFYLSCDISTGGSKVRWYFNNIEQMLLNKTWKIAFATPEHSGSYRCESNGQQSDDLNIEVLGYIPSASLIIKIGQPVMRTGGSVVLQLDNNDGLQGWKCWVYREVKTKRIKLKLENNSVSVTFQPTRLDVLETIFWCTDNTRKYRSNQIIVRTSEKDVSLEMYPLPAVAGESLTLRCLVWGTDQVSHTVFYKDDAIIWEGVDPTHKIPSVSGSAKGKYKCDATFTHKARTSGPPYHVASDNQDVFVQEAHMKAVLSGNMGLSCSCPLCPGQSSYLWYHKNDDGQPWALKDATQGFVIPEESGTYACRAVWNNGRSFLSNTLVYKTQINVVLVIVVVLVLLILGLAVIATAFYIWYKKRNATGPIYEDMPLRSRDKGDDKYETLHKPRGAQGEGEYDTLHPEAPGRERKEGDYQPLKKEGMQEGVYHTLGVEGAAGGAGGYEALKKEGMKDGVYHTLGMEGAAGGAGGYEALKKEGMKDGVYHTMGMEGAAGGAGGYEALKKEGMKDGVYHTLEMEGAAGGAGGYEALKKEGMKEGVYHTLGTEGAAGGAGGYEAVGN